MSSEENRSQFAAQGQHVADKTAAKLQSGIESARTSANQTADRLSDRVEQGRSATGPTIQKAADGVKAAADWTTQTVGAATDKVRTTAADLGDTVVSYTQDNPVKALGIALAVGAVLGSILSVARRNRV